MRCTSIVLATIVVWLVAVSESPAGKGSSKGGSSAGKSSGSKTVHVKGHYRAGHYVQPHTRSAPGKAVHTYSAPVAPRMDARVTARGSAPAEVIVGAPQLPASADEDRETVVPTPLPAQPEARTTARVSPPASSRAAPAVWRVPEPREVDPEQDAARMLTLAATVEESAKEAKAERRTRDAQRLFEVAERRYAEIVKKFPKTNAAGEARKAISWLQRS